MGKGKRLSWAAGAAILFCTLSFILGRGSKTESLREKERAMMLASSKFTVSDWRGAEEEYGKAIELDPRDWSTWHGRGLARCGVGDFPGALADFEKAIGLNGSFGILYEHRGVAQAKLGQFRGAVNDFSQAIALNPSNGGCHFNRAQARERLGDRDGAISDYEKAIELMSPLDMLHHTAIQRLMNLKVRRSQTF